MRPASDMPEALRMTQGPCKSWSFLDSSTSRIYRNRLKLKISPSGVFYGYAPLFYGRVVDFLDFDFFHFTIFGRTFERFPVFNIADASVTIGVLILILFYKHHQKETETALTGATADIDPGSINLNQGTTNDEPDKGKEIPL